MGGGDMGYNPDMSYGPEDQQSFGDQDMGPYD